MKKFEMLNVICKDCELTAKEKLVAQYFVYKSNKAGACYPCVATIAEECCISRRTVQRATKKLAEKSYIIIEKRFKYGKQTSNLYSFNIFLMEEIEKEKEKIQEEETAEDKAMEVVDLEELLAIQEQETIVDEEMEEIDLDDLVAANDSEWEDAYDVPFEEQEINVSGKPEQQRMFSFSVAKVMTWLLGRFYLISQCNIVIVEITWLPFKIAIYVRGNNGTYTISRASSNIMGAFFPP